jgi:hypothetical protein
MPVVIRRTDKGERSKRTYSCFSKDLLSLLLNSLALAAVNGLDLLPVLNPSDCGGTNA